MIGLTPSLTVEAEFVYARKEQPGEKSGANDRTPRPPVARPGGVARESVTRATILALQRSVGNAAVLRMLDGQPVQRSAVHGVLSSAGRPLDEPLRAEMERRLDADFSDVRVHADTEARRSAAEIGARAYTSGSHVVLGEDGEDRHTLTHELVHVLQQRRGPVSGSDTGRGFRVSDPSDRFEREADAVATRALAQAPLSTTAPSDPTPGGAHHSGHAEVQRASRQEEDAMDIDRESDLESDYGEFPLDSAEAAQVVESAEAKEHTRKYNEIVRAIFEELSRKRWQVKWDEKPTREGWRAFTARKPDNSGKVKVAEPREMGGEERALRWLSTAVRTFLELSEQKPVELQCGVHEGEFYIASNDAECNKKLKAMVTRSNGNFRKYLEDISVGVSTQLSKGYAPSGLPDYDAEKKAAELERLERHSGNAVSALGSESGQYREILEAMAKTVRVPEEGPKEESRGTHAEKRIWQLTGNVTPKLIGGTRRNCLTCYLDLYPTGSGTGRPGHLYSTELMRDVDVSTQDAGSIVKTLLDKMEKAGVQATYRTLTKGRKATTERYGSDSE